MWQRSLKKSDTSSTLSCTPTARTEPFDLYDGETANFGSDYSAGVSSRFDTQQTSNPPHHHEEDDFTPYGLKNEHEVDKKFKHELKDNNLVDSSMSQQFLSAWNFKSESQVNRFANSFSSLSSDHSRLADPLTDRLNDRSVETPDPTDLNAQKYSPAFFLRYRSSRKFACLDCPALRLVDRVFSQPDGLSVKPAFHGSSNHGSSNSLNRFGRESFDEGSDWRFPNEELSFQTGPSFRPSDIHQCVDEGFPYDGYNRRPEDFDYSSRARTDHHSSKFSKSFSSTLNNFVSSDGRQDRNSDDDGSCQRFDCGSDELPDENRHSPRNTAAFSPSNFGVSPSDSLTCARRRIVPFGDPNFFNFLKSLPQNELVHLARSVARYRRSSRLDSTPSTIVSINLCSCCTRHPNPVSGVNFQTDFWSHKIPPNGMLHGVLDTSLSVMLVELHPVLEVVEFLDRRLPAVIRQQVGNRLDRNFVVQIFGISFMRSHLSDIWTIGDLPECTAADMRRLCSHPLYHHMLFGISNRQQIPVFRNLNLCPIQYSNSRPLPVSNGLHSSSSGYFSPSNRTHAFVSSPPTECSSYEAFRVS